jgi:hypothetical protein
LYWDYPSWVKPAIVAWNESGKIGPSPSVLFAEVRKTINRAVELSMITCEGCGADVSNDKLACPGKTMSGTRWCVSCRD